MAGDWIKVRDDLVDDPAVAGIGTILGLDKYAVVGRLVKVWSWLDRQSRDGHAAVARSYIDELVHTPGMGAAMEQVRWLQVVNECHIFFPNFERHNGKSAKKRALATRRKQDERARKTVTPPSRSRHAGRVTREEKSISNKHLPVPNSTARSPTLGTPLEEPHPQPPRTASTSAEAHPPDRAPIPDSVREAIERKAKASGASIGPYRGTWEHSREGVLQEAQRRGIQPLEGESASSLLARVRAAPEPQQQEARA